ncbi:MAG: hypothetical protein KC505_07875 [Myxococcales bacterium]|nr:hypothetical protein [Myxococcales bacterium]USN50663.1 MAG: hypothetical protein H6731_10435 [Myxococcales bacterium]
MFLKTISAFCLASFSVSAFSDFNAQDLGPCQAAAYGTTTSGSAGDSTLLSFDLSDGAGTTIGTITGNGIHRVTAVEFSPYGVLYGVGEDVDNASSLIVIHCITAKSLEIGPTGIPSGQTITDLSFDSNGVLWGYAHGGSNPDTVGTINLGTGAYTAVGQTGINTDNGNGLFHDASGNLYHAGGTNLSLLNQSTGAATTVTALSFTAPGNDNPRYTALDIKNGVVYGALNDKPNGSGSQPDNYIVTFNIATGGMAYLASPILNAPNNTAGFSINPNY